jgi:hypothetical protein
MLNCHDVDHGSQGATSTSGTSTTTAPFRVEGVY